MNVARWLIAFVLATTVPAIPSTQTEDVRFEVASIRPRASRSGATRLDYKGETFSATNVSLAQLIRMAYGVGPFLARPFAEVQGEPSWVSDRYDVVAKTARPVPLVRLGGFGFGPPLNLMLQSLLAERFQLVVHWETRERDGYALVLARSDGSLGPGIRRSALDCDAWRAARRSALAAGLTPPPSLSRRSMRHPGAVEP